MQEYVKYRQLVVTSFAIDAGKLLGSLIAHYQILESEGFPVESLSRVLNELRSGYDVKSENLN